MFTNKLELNYANELHDYDIFPKVLPAGVSSEITIKPLGTHAEFKHDNYKLSIHPWDEGSPWCFPDYCNDFSYEVAPQADGCIRFSFEFFGQQQHFIRLSAGDFQLQLSVFSVLKDLVGRYPFRGDLHLHSTGSDGKQAAPIAAANYRKTGYDFLAITDHHNYAPSLEAIETYKDVPIELCIVPGEEVHVPCDNKPGQAKQHFNNMHIINFGGQFSLNELWHNNEQAHWDEIDAYMQTLDIPDCFVGRERYYYASCHWVFEQIHKADGLGIFCHPYWLDNVLQIPPQLTEKLLEHLNFDAFEVLGGENYFEQNGFQTVQYYQSQEKGHCYAIVGSTDSHNSVNNRNSHLCSTIVFSPKNERRALIQSIKDRYSVAVDTIDQTPRFVGELGLVRYACFLDKHFFPLHDELCFEEGRAMKDYACGVPGAKETLQFISGRMKTQREKYFGF